MKVVGERYSAAAQNAERLGLFLCPVCTSLIGSCRRMVQSDHRSNCTWVAQMQRLSKIDFLAPVPMPERGLG